MVDPTRIDRTLAALRDAWEGQPELPLGTLFGMLAAEGYGWGVDDEELTARLRSMAAVRAPALPLSVAGEDPRVRRVQDGVWLVVTDTHRVTIDNARVVVRVSQLPEPPAASTAPPQPTLWGYTSVRPTGPGRPLVIADAEGFEHRLGVVRSTTRLADAPVPAAGLTRRRLGDYAWVIATADATISLGHRLTSFAAGRRSVSSETLAWDELVMCEVGQPLIVRLARGVTREFGVVTDIALAEAPPRDGADA